MQKKPRRKRGRAAADLALIASVRPLVRAEVTPERMVRSVARLLAIEIGHYVIADLVDRVGVLRRAHIEHADPRQAPRLRTLCEDTVLAPNGRVPRLLARAATELVSNVSDAVRSKNLVDLAVAEEPVRSYMASTIVVNGDPMGVLSLVSTKRRHRYTQDDANILDAVADLLGLGIENALGREARPRASMHPAMEAPTGTMRRRQL